MSYTITIELQAPTAQYEVPQVLEWIGDRLATKGKDNPIVVTRIDVEAWNER